MVLARQKLSWPMPDQVQPRERKSKSILTGIEKRPQARPGASAFSILQITRQWSDGSVRAIRAAFTLTGILVLVLRHKCVGLRRGASPDVKQDDSRPSDLEIDDAIGAIANDFIHGDPGRRARRRRLLVDAKEHCRLHTDRRPIARHDDGDFEYPRDLDGINMVSRGGADGTGFCCR